MNAHLLKEVQTASSKFGAYYGLLDFRYKNLCVKSDGTSLMSVSVMANGYECNIEEVAMVAQPNEFQLAVIPNEEMYLKDIIKGVFEAHPEFKMKMMLRTDEGAEELGDDQDDDSDAQKQGQKYILYTMPDVDKDRRDLLTEGVKVLHRECKSKIEIVNFDAQNKMLEGSFISTQKEIEEAADQLKQTYEKTKEMVDQLLEKKFEEIEEAYQKYLEDHPADEESDPGFDVTKGVRMTEE